MFTEWVSVFTYDIVRACFVSVDSPLQVYRLLLFDRSATVRERLKNKIDFRERERKKNKKRGTRECMCVCTRERETLPFFL